MFWVVVTLQHICSPEKILVIHTFYLTWFLWVKRAAVHLNMFWEEMIRWSSQTEMRWLDVILHKCCWTAGQVIPTLRLQEIIVGRGEQKKRKKSKTPPNSKMACNVFVQVLLKCLRGVGWNLMGEDRSVSKLTLLQHCHLQDHSRWSEWPAYQQALRHLMAVRMKIKRGFGLPCWNSRPKQPESRASSRSARVCFISTPPSVTHVKPAEDTLGNSHFINQIGTLC